MAVDAYTEFIKYNYHDIERELGPEATPQDIIEYLLQSWKQLSITQKAQYEQYRRQRLTSTYENEGGRSDEEEKNDFESVWKILVLEWFPAWRASHNPQGGPRQPYSNAQFGQYAKQKWLNLSPEEKDYYRQLDINSGNYNRPVRKRVGKK